MKHSQKPDTSAITQLLSLLNEREPVFDRSLLIEIGKDLRPAIDRFILEKRYQAIQVPPWATASQRFDDLFGYTRTPGHFFRADPIDWTKFSEPQVTGGLVHFLTEPGIEEGILQLRFKAVLKAFGIPSPAKFTHMQANAEPQDDERKRIDIYLEWKDAAGIFGNAVIEAKFGHTLTIDQLKPYENYAYKIIKENKSSSDLSHFIVLAPMRRLSSMSSLDISHRWRFISWKTWLMHLGQHLNEPALSPDFSRYLRTVWLRAAQ